MLMPMIRPGILRAIFGFVDRKPACGPPYPSGTPRRCAEPTAMSAPNSAGGVSEVSARRSVATASFAPAAVAFSAKGL